MRWLEGGQTAMMLALDRGPAHLPQGVFRGPAERILAGMKIHANTISHARLVAMEETYPRTRAGLGHAAFIESARLFLEQAGWPDDLWPASAKVLIGFWRERKSLRRIARWPDLNGSGSKPTMPRKPSR